MMMAIFRCLDWLWQVGLLNLHKWMVRLMHLDKAIFFLKPLGTSSFGLTDRLAVSTDAPGWLDGSANISSEFNIIDNWEYALSITPYASADFGLEQIRTGATILAFTSICRRPFEYQCSYWVRGKSRNL